MSTPSDPSSWPADAPEADVAEQQQNAYPDPADDPEDPLPPGDEPGPAVDADEADVVEQSRELPWEDGDEER